MARQLADWITSYLGYVAPASEAPLDFHLWSALTVISAALRRHCWIGRGTWQLFPNLYTVLVGRPGIGKGSAINPAIALLNESKQSHILTDRMTIEYAMERMAKGWPIVSPINNNQQPTIPIAQGMQLGFDHTATIVSRELSVFLTASQYTIQILTDLWDSNEEYTYATRGKGEYRIDSPCISLIGGSTQEWLVRSIPASAVGGGFTRRVNFVLAYDREKLIPWPVVSNHSPIRDQLVGDLKAIGQSVKGEFKFSREAVPLFETVYSESTPTEFDDEATTSYKTSKWAQVSKVAICISAARGDSLVISKENLELAYTAVHKVAENINKVFRAVGESDLVVASDKVLRLLEEKGYASRQELIHALWRDVTSEELDKILLTFREGGVIREVVQSNKVRYALIDKKP